jgi:regulator of sigma E protease
MFSILGAILAIGLLIVVHEAGHYFVARRCRMRVDRFSIGFGPPILKWRRGETDFTLGPIPFGGFVQIRGMTLADEVEAEDASAYPNRPAWQRFATIFAGPATNYLFAIVIAIVLYAAAGIKTGTAWYAVAGVEPGFDAHGKLEPGDRIVAVEGQPVYFLRDGKLAPKGQRLPELVDRSAGQPLDVTVLRGGQELKVAITPKLGQNETGAEVYRLGIQLTDDEERASVGVLSSIGHALVYPVEQTKVIAVGLYEIATRQQEAVFMGPVGITSMIKKTIDVGWIRVLELLMLLNVYLGLFNLLPLPALDGGRLVFLGYEMATRRRANPKIEAAVHMVGIMALLLLMVLVTYKDIARLF